MGNMKKANYIISAIMFLVGIGIVALASSLKIKLGEGDPGAGFWPMLLGALIIVFSAVLLISTIKNKKKLEEHQFLQTSFYNINTSKYKSIYSVWSYYSILCNLIFSWILCWYITFYSDSNVFVGSKKCKKNCIDNSNYFGCYLCTVWNAA